MAYATIQVHYNQEAGEVNMEGFYVEIIFNGVTKSDELNKDLIIEKFNELVKLFNKKDGVMTAKAQLNIMSESEVLATLTSDDTFN